MKKILVVLFSLFVLFGCSNGNNTDQPDGNNNSPVDNNSQEVNDNNGDTTEDDGVANEDGENNNASSNDADEVKNDPCLKIIYFDAEDDLLYNEVIQ